jgi:hypothetical protein
MSFYYRGPTFFPSYHYRLPAAFGYWPPYTDIGYPNSYPYIRPYPGPGGRPYTQTYYGSCDCTLKTQYPRHNNCNRYGGYFPVCTRRNCTCCNVLGDCGCFGNQGSDC